MFLLATLAVRAAEPTAASTAEPSRYWSEVDRKSRGTYRAGWVVAVAGLGTEIAGQALGSATIAGVGSAAGLASGPMVIGGALRSRRALAEQGALAQNGAGAVAWTTWTVGIASSIGAYATGPTNEDVAAALGVTALGCGVTSYVAAAVQNAHNRAARGHLRAVAQAR
jgi:hypothetical protein